MLAGAFAHSPISGAPHRAYLSHVLVALSAPHPYCCGSDPFDRRVRSAQWMRVRERAGRRDRANGQRHHHGHASDREGVSHRHNDP
ncbi:hypothetical protein PSCLAVI8L_50128 [Pseudoclavibacter sp. 8L]|nr:hypothetical protein PSCLAVI8L_50128 [Pseudoclavibacter sp. 8L]